MKTFKRTMAVLLSLTMAVSLVACGEKPAENSENPIADETAKPAILVVSFGTSYNETRAVTIDAIEKEIAEKFPDHKVYRAFTSNMIIKKLAERDNLIIDTVAEAMERIVADGVKDIVIQPTHVMNGFEYDELVAAVTPYKESFDSFVIGSPLLTSEEDFNEMADILLAENKDYLVPETALVFMGHGTEHESNVVYQQLWDLFKARGLDNIVVATVEAEPSVEDAIEAVKSMEGVNKVVLMPLMIVAGDHANSDMAGDEEGSWKNMFKSEGYEVECVLKGLGEYTGIRNMIDEHIADAMAK